MPGGHRVFVTGGGGFVGSALIEQLLSRGYSINALINRKPIETRGEVTSIRGDLFDDASLDAGMRGGDAVIHLVGIIMERPARGITFDHIHHQGTRRVVDATRRNGIKRYLHMSALGTRPNAVAEYHKTKWLAEEYVRASGLDWTIFRPSIIHGPRGEFMQMEAKWARHIKPPFLFMPYFGAGLLGFGGAGKLQPVYVGDVARAFVDALENRRTIGEVYPLGGPDVVTWPQLHHIASEAITGHKRIAIPMPVWAAKIQASLLPPSVLGFNKDQVQMSQEDSTCDLSKFTSDFGWEPQPLEASIKSYAQKI
jgi:NADH dehydrogenase